MYFFHFKPNRCAAMLTVTMKERIHPTPTRVTWNEKPSTIQSTFTFPTRDSFAGVGPSLNFIPKCSVPFLHAQVECNKTLNAKRTLCTVRVMPLRIKVEKQ